MILTLTSHTLPDVTRICTYVNDLSAFQGAGEHSTIRAPFSCRRNSVTNKRIQLQLHDALLASDIDSITLDHHIEWRVNGHIVSCHSRCNVHTKI